MLPKGDDRCLVLFYFWRQQDVSSNIRGHKIVDSYFQ